ncbi:MAG: hypothetical protein ACREJB_03920 [Planctomycetaceae bacterium]
MTSPDEAPPPAFTRQQYLQAEYDQAEVDALLARGLVFAILFCLCGFGSAYAVWLAWRARQIIKASEVPLDGMLRVWCCFVIGGIGVFILLAAMVTIIIKG